MMQFVDPGDVVYVVLGGAMVVEAEVLGVDDIYHDPEGSTIWHHRYGNSDCEVKSTEVAEGGEYVVVRHPLEKLQG